MSGARTVRIGRRFATLAAAAASLALTPATASAGSAADDASIASAAGAFKSYQECMIVRSEYARYYRIDSACYAMSGIPLLGYPDWYFLYSSR